ncbi:hypothetical protein EV644_11587 [Kribbella orskensis]|uniref:Uncharacterized protein n=1 Tax=Kribbella orskensis TaxID=2512216 RepID=A0ABY2BDC2_9ACTN|nr:hypothetical protein EV642_11687 [Kribbella sp. VKM Ac-2500]TCO17067.1 hypothetical protein EV644_11587 [Kribbella orskensis]
MRFALGELEPSTGPDLPARTGIASRHHQSTEVTCGSGQSPSTPVLGLSRDRVPDRVVRSASPEIFTMRKVCSPSFRPGSVNTCRAVTRTSLKRFTRLTTLPLGRRTPDRVRLGKLSSLVVEGGGWESRRRCWAGGAGCGWMSRPPLSSARSPCRNPPRVRRRARPPGQRVRLPTLTCNCSVSILTGLLAGSLRPGTTRRRAPSTPGPDPDSADAPGPDSGPEQGTDG